MTIQTLTDLILVITVARFVISQRYHTHLTEFGLAMDILVRLRLATEYEPRLDQTRLISRRSVPES